MRYRFLKKIVLTGGGTAGHITPNIAMIALLQEEGYEVYYIGSKDSMEEKLIRPLGIPFETVAVGRLRRYFTLKNLVDPFRAIAGAFQAKRILRRIKPDVVFAKGGFVSVPVVAGAYMRGIPSVLHESDRSPGLANKLCIPMCRTICTSFEETQKILGEKAVYTGLPVRRTLMNGDAEKARVLCGFSSERPVVMVMGGSQGAQAINEAVRAALPQLLECYQIIHLCGEGNLDPEKENLAGYMQMEYANEQLPDLFAMTDIAISRAGATALFEFAALEIPVLAIPLPKGASRGDQIDNAEDFAKRGWLRHLPQEDLTPEKLVEEVGALYDARDTYKEALKQADMAGAGERVYAQIVKAGEQKKKK